MGKVVAFTWWKRRRAVPLDRELQLAADDLRVAQALATYRREIEEKHYAAMGELFDLLAMSAPSRATRARAIALIKRARDDAQENGREVEQ